MQEWVLLHHGYVLYGSLFLMLLGGAFGLPIPEDLPLVLAGVVVHLGKAQPLFMFLMCYSAILLGDIVIYSFGRRFGPALFSKGWFQKRFTPARISDIRNSLEKRSLLMIFVARHLFYLRTVTFLACGAVRMNAVRFLISDAIAALVSVPVMMAIGFFAAEHYHEVVKNAQLALCLLAVFILVFYGFHVRRNHRA